MPSNQGRRFPAIIFRLFLCFLAFQVSAQAFAGETYFTDTDNEDNAGSGSPDGDMDFRLGSGSAIYPIEFNIDVTGALPTTSAILTINANDVDEEAGETDTVFLNGVELGRLSGENNVDNTTRFSVDPSIIQPGNNLVEITIADTSGNGTNWQLTVYWGQLLVDGGSEEDADTTAFSITNYGIAGSTVTMDVDAVIDINTTGDYRVELNVIDPDGNNIGVLSEDFSATAGETLTKSYSPTYQIEEQSGTYTIEALLFYNDGGFPVQQDFNSVSFTHVQNEGPELPGTAEDSTLSANPVSIVADGITTSTITLQARDVAANNTSFSGQTVTFSTTSGTLGTVTDNGDGTYSATLTSDTTAGNATVTGTIDGETVVDNATVTFTPGPASAANTTLTAAPLSITADGVTTSIVTVQAIDANGNALTSGGDTVVLATTAGTLSNVTDNGDGTYSATLTSSTTAETATITGTLDGTDITDSASVEFVPGDASAATSTVTATPSSITADGVSNTTITVQAKDANGNNLTTGGDTIALSSNAGTLSNFADNGDGTYTALLTSSTAKGTATVSGTLNAASITDSASVAFVAGPATAANTTITASPSPITADGTTTSTVTVQAVDANGNSLDSGGNAVVLTTSSGSLGPVTDNGNGTYTATLTSSTEAGTALVRGTLDASQISDTASVEFAPGDANGSQSTIATSLPTLVADSNTQSGLAVQAVDENGNALTTGGDTVTLSATLGTVGNVTDNGDGSYSATFTSGNTTGSSNITGTINGVAIGNTGTITLVERPTVDSLLTNDSTPELTGTAVVFSGASLTVNVNARTYTEGDGNLTLTGNNWTLVIPGSAALSDGQYEVVATVTDSAGQQSSDISTDELTVDVTLPTISLANSEGPDSTTTPAYTVAGSCSAVDDTLDLDISDASTTLSRTGIACADDGSGGGSFSVVFDTTELDDGPISISAIIRDTATNQATDQVNLVKDVCSPDNTVSRCDEDDDGVPDGFEIAAGTDPSVPDSDGDGIPDAEEFGGDLSNPRDSDGDGVIDALDTDSDNDGISDAQELGGDADNPRDTDGDGQPDYRDTDSDNDRVPDIVETLNGLNDADGDLIPDYRDTDSDNDGIPDALENGLSTGDDSDGDGIDDAFDVNATGGTDSNNDGIDDDIVALLDTDLDGIVDTLDIDSDNDGIPDSVETDLLPLLDSDGDGIHDRFDVTNTGGTDSNNDGIDDALTTLVNTDGDLVPDYRDLDSDNDGLTDVREAGGADSAPEDGLIDDPANNQGTLFNPADDDADALPNYRDIESSNPANDGSGPFDVSNRDDAATVDADNDGLIDDTADQDGDGIADAVDRNVSGFGAQILPTVDTLLTNDSTPTLNGTLQSFSGSQFDVTVNGQTYVESNPALVIDGSTWTLTIPAGAALPDGQFDVTATIRDAQGNASSDTTSGELVVDLQAPTVTLDALANADGNNTTAYTLSGQCTEIADMIGILISDQDGRSVSDSTPQCQDDGNGNGRFSTTLDLSNLQDGPLDVQVIAMDLAGNETETDGRFAKNACQPDANSSLCDVDRDDVPDGFEADNGLSTTSNDSDGDGIPDAEEFGGDLSNPRDSDGDGVIDALDTDSDNDGISDAQELGGDADNPRDTDGDGQPDYRDTDSDNDRVPDIVETLNGLNDADGDLIPDYRDTDSDNDGIPDALENGLSTGDDSDGDGIDDAFDVNATGGTDSNNDGIDDDIVALLDTDLDGIVDTLDIDSDNDGIPDSVETDLLPLLDSDGDGIHDRFDVTNTGGTDSNNDGIDDALTTLVNTDGDLVPDYRDLDSDNDGLTDVREAGGADSAPEDGLIDDPANNQGTLFNPADDDADALPNYRDIESSNPANDGSGPFDVSNRDDAATVDADNDGLVDDTADRDGDGIADIVDESDFGFGSLEDYDLDGINNRADLDDDNDGIPDAAEGSGLIDTDGDNLPDSLDPDSDNDGISDVLEANQGRLDSDSDTYIDLFLDADLNGLDDGVAVDFLPIDSDSDGVADFQDLDSDNDGIVDLVEAADKGVDIRQVDSNGDGMVDLLGINGNTSRRWSPIDFDGDGREDYRDIDSDGDGYNDDLEGGDFDGDGQIDRLDNSGELETAVRGVGGVGVWMLTALLALVLVRRSGYRHALPLLAAAVAFSLPGLSQADAGQCGYQLSSSHEIVTDDDGEEDVQFSDCFYGNLGLGLTHIDPEGESNGWRTNDDSDWGWKVAVGHHFAPHWFWELSYSDLGEAGLGNRNPALERVTPDAHIDYQVPSLMAGYWFREPGHRFNAFVKAGASLIQNSASDDRIGYDEQSTLQFSLGVGVQYRPLESAWFIRAELDSYDRDARYLGLQLGRYFGGPDRR
ncbi:invasin domain 3-containing protein [Marinobacter sp.]|uniref:invasin domain 3-containing protein n=1 Tax=Marinobacter sp. TaxID=50741 RepID=UPI0026227D48|nr:invasin domain 3-containing protein [Marinobacter sp.]